MVIGMAEERWSRKYGWIDPEASYASKDLAVERVYAGFGGATLEEQLPRCPKSGSLDIRPVLVSDPPAA
jgi:hypothetical protein